MSQQLRKQLLVNPQVQGPLVARTSIYWAACILFLLFPATVFRTWQSPERLIFAHLLDVCVDYSAVLVSAAILLPFAIYDMLKLSNRIAGPLFRLRREMSQVGDGERARKVQFRPDDFWHELATEFNKIVDRTQTDRPPTAASTDIVDEVLSSIEADVDNGTEVKSTH